MRTIIYLYPLLALGLFGADWPQLRGPNGSGLCPLCGKLPTEFGPEKNVLWKTELAPGKSSPVLVGNRIFLTASEGDDLITICLSRTTGKVQWQRRWLSMHYQAPHSDRLLVGPDLDGDGCKEVFAAWVAEDCDTTCGGAFCARACCERAVVTKIRPINSRRGCMRCPFVLLGLSATESGSRSLPAAAVT